jgi:cell fate (sporulation/competence/biofilm development) regulator YlbF (YheA/YmcA/DUF963 family)
MPDDIKDILDAAQKLGDMVAKHPSVEKFKQAQRSVMEDPEASRLFGDFDRQIESLARQEQSGMPITDAQRMQLESLQSRLASHIKIKNLNMAQVEFMDVMRKVSQAWQRPLAEASGTGSPAAAGLRATSPPTGIQ